MTPEQLSARATHTVISFRPNRYCTYRNSVTGELVNEGMIRFDCGHGYKWYPWAAERNPRRGDVEMCAKCLDEALTEATAEVCRCMTEPDERGNEHVAIHSAGCPEYLGY